MESAPTATTTAPSKPDGAPLPASALEQRIAARIHAFDVPALFDVLSLAGYQRSEIEFRSHNSNLHQTGLLHSIQFIRAPFRRVLIEVNLGLLSLQTPLPSFFLQRIEGQATDMMLDFISCFDHLLLEPCFRGLYPEREEATLPGWDRTARDRLRLLRLACPSSLHWLFQKVYPEAELTVRRTAQTQRIATSGMRIGTAALGDGTAIGGFASIPVGGMEVRLCFDDSFSGTGIPWALEADRRFDKQIVPLIGETDLTLTLWLRFRDQTSFARLRDDSYLGYDPLQGGPEHPLDVLLFSGNVAERSTPEK